MIRKENTMKTYQKPEIEMIIFTTENIAVDGSVNVGGSNNLEDE